MFVRLTLGSGADQAISAQVCCPCGEENLTLDLESFPIGGAGAT